MKKFSKIAAVFVLTAAAVGLTAQGFQTSGSRTGTGTDKAVYDRTMKELDTGGLVLTYRNTQESVNFVREIVKLAAGQFSASEGGDAEKISSMAEDFFAQSGLSSIQSIGSSVSRSGDLYTLKGFVSASSSRNGLIWDLVAENKSVSELLRYVPQNAVLAAGGTVRLKPAYDRVMKLLQKYLPSREYEQLTSALNSLKEEGIDLPHQLSAWTGYTLYLENQPDKQPIVPGVTGGTLILQMADDSLYRLILLKVDPDQVSNGVVMIPDTPLMMMQKNGLLVVTTDSKLFDNIQKKGFPTLAADPDFRVYAKGLPAAGTGFFWWGPGAKSTCESLIRAFCPQDQQKLLQEVLRLTGFDKPILAFSSSSSGGVLTVIRAGTGNLLCPMASGIMAADPASVLPAAGIAAGMLLPAVGAAKETGMQANCTNNLKQIGMALMIYENDHNGFPKQKGIAGLEELRKEGYLDEPKAFVCPSSKKAPAAPGEKLSEETCSYIYFGGLTSAASPDLPIVMEKPGNHDPRKIAYLRLDGSVARPGYDLGDTAEKMVYSILGKTSGFDRDEMNIVKQAKAWDMAHSK